MNVLYEEEAALQNRILYHYDIRLKHNASVFAAVLDVILKNVWLSFMEVLEFIPTSPLIIGIIEHVYNYQRLF